MKSFVTFLYPLGRFSEHYFLNFWEICENLSYQPRVAQMVYQRYSRLKKSSQLPINLAKIRRSSPGFGLSKKLRPLLLFQILILPTVAMIKSDFENVWWHFLNLFQKVHNLLVQVFFHGKFTEMILIFQGYNLLSRNVKNGSKMAPSM